MTPAETIQALASVRGKRSNRAILDELRALKPLPETWRDDTWQRAYLLVALGDLVATRKLASGIGLLLDKMSIDDAGELMRGMRHAFEAAIDERWARLAAICVERTRSRRAGTRYWAVDELGYLREPKALPAVLARFEDTRVEVAELAFRAALMIAPEDPRIVPALEKAARRRDRQDAARGCLAELPR
jgi:hypothetical protein